jgi:hypothetical protein
MTMAKITADDRARLHRILDAVIDRNEAGKSSFFDYSGNVNAVVTELYDGEWNPKQEPVRHFCFIGGNRYFGDSLESMENAVCGN